MEVAQVSVKQENTDSFCLAEEPNADSDTKILNLMEIKVEPVKIEPPEEPPYYESEQKNLDPIIKLSEVKLIKSEKSLLDCSKSSKLVEPTTTQKEGAASGTKRKDDSLKSDLGSHKKPKSTTKYKCDFCNFETIHEKGLKRHISAKHEGSDSGGYKCDKCEYRTFYKAYFTNHIILHDNLDKDKVHKTTNLNCDFCQQFKTTHEGTLKRHIVEKHEMYDAGGYKCDKCKYRTFHKAFLINHILIHNNPDKDIKVYKCGHCDFLTVNKNHIPLHLLRHFNPKVYR